MKIKVHNPNNLPTLPYEALLDFQGDLKIIDDAALEKLKQSIIDHGFIVPKFVWQDGEFSYIMDGHQTRKALDSLSSEGYDIPEIPIVRVEANNRQDAAIKLLQINSRYGSLNPETNFFDRMELDPLEILPLVELPELEELIIDEVPEISELDDNVPELSESDPIIKRGDFFRLGKHYLLCGDSTQIVDVEKVLRSEKADMCFTDPPYGISVVGGGGQTKFGKVGGGGWVESNFYSIIQGDDSTDSAKEFYNTCIALDIENFIIWGGNYFTDFLPVSRCWIIWNKQMSGNFADAELAWTSFDKVVKLYDWLWNGLSRKGERDEELLKRVHPTQKPVGLHRNILADFSSVNDIILDGFLGSGTTLIACEKLNRQCRGIEISPKYCEVIIKRWFDTFINDDFEHINGNLKLKEIVNND